LFYFNNYQTRQTSNNNTKYDTFIPKSDFKQKTK